MSTYMINGYLECNGTIMHITSMEDLNRFTKIVNNSFSEKDLDILTDFDVTSGETITDDCNVIYLKSPQVLLGGYRNANYKVKDQTLAIANSAYSNGSHHPYSSTMQAIQLPNSVLVIGDWAFNNNRSLQNVILSSSIVKIGKSAFESCSSLSNIILPNTLVFLKANVFKFSGLEKIDIPQTVNDIGSHAFYACEKLKLIRFRGVPNIIGSGVFDYCNSIERIYIPKGAKSVFIEKLLGVREELFEEV